jgi:hypothetical protein
MSHSSPSRKPTSAAPGVKLLMTAAALAGTLAGWAALAANEGVAAVAASSGPVIQAGALPTLVAPPKSSGVAALAAPTPALRRVNAPPALAGPSSPVTVTRSSR